MTHEEMLQQLLNSDEGKALLVNVIEKEKQPLVSKRDELLGELTEFKSKYKSLVEEVETLKAKQPETKKTDNTEELPIVVELRKMLSVRENEINTIKDKLINDKVESLITKSIADNKGIPELLLPAVQRRVKAIKSDDGDVKLEVFDSFGKPMFKDGQPASLNDLMAEFKDAGSVYHRAFEGHGSSGSGARQNQSKSSNGVELDPSKPGYSVTKAMEFYKNNPSFKR